MSSTVAYKLQEILRSGVIGEIRSAQAELNVDFTKTVGSYFSLNVFRALWTQNVAPSTASPLGVPSADFSFFFFPLQQAKADPSHRLVNPDLCGGSLLDLGFVFSSPPSLQLGLESATERRAGFLLLSLSTLLPPCANPPSLLNKQYNH